MPRTSPSGLLSRGTESSQTLRWRGNHAVAAVPDSHPDCRWPHRDCRATVFVSRARLVICESDMCMRMKLAAPKLLSALVEADIDAVLDKKASHAPRPRASIDVPCFYLNDCFVLAAAICGKRLHWRLPFSLLRPPLSPRPMRFRSTMPKSMTQVSSACSCTTTILQSDGNRPTSRVASCRTTR